MLQLVFVTRGYTDDFVVVIGENKLGKIKVGKYKFSVFYSDDLVVAISVSRI